MPDFTNRKALNQISARAAQDKEFRKRLLEDPNSAITEVTGAAVPENVRIKFVEKDPEVDVMVVLPDCVPEDGELTEEDVSSVTGGTDWGCEGGTSSL